MKNLKLLFAFFYRPHSAMSEVIDKGSWLFGAIAVLIVAAVFQFTINAKLNETYSIPKFDAPARRPLFYSKVEDYDDADEAAEYEAAIRDYQNTLKNRQTLPIVGDYGLKFISFDESFLATVISLSFLYAPVTMLLLSFLAPIGSFSLLLRRDYGTFLMCVFFAWTAAHLPLAIAGVLLDSQTVSPLIYLAMWFAGNLFFGVLMIFALRTVFGVNYLPAVLTLCFSWLSMSAGIYIFRFVPPILFSPFLLFYAYAYLKNDVDVMGYSYKRRQNFKRFLNNATVNPHDADARVQLALIYLQRRQEAQALEYLDEAIKIDKNEIDANYHLGKIARSKGDLQKALNYFSVVVEQNDKYALSEIWREIGATYLEANMLAEAREALEKFVSRRPVDSEGLYYLGKVYKLQNEPEKAREMFEQAIESARDSPDYRRRELNRWSKLARKEI